MDKRIFSVLVLTSVLLGGSVFYKYHQLQPPTPAAVTQQEQAPVPPKPAPEPKPEPKQPTLDDALKSITADQLKNYVTTLASDKFEGRRAGTTGNNEAAKWIGETLTAAGLKVEYHKFQFNQKATQNVYAWIDGKSDEIVVVGAHYDHLGKGYPGADDNASGTATVMAIAKAYAVLTENKPILNRTIVFQFYSAEEAGLYGSRFYCNYPQFPKSKPDMRRHVFMLNLDMVGYLNSGYYKTAMVHDSAPDVGALISGLSTKYPFAKSITSRGGGGSDHASFLNAGIPCAWFFTGMHNNYHKPSDTPDRLNYNGMEQIGKYGVELSLAVVQDSKVPGFNRTGFEVIPYDFDHDSVPFLK